MSGPTVVARPSRVEARHLEALGASWRRASEPLTYDNCASALGWFTPAERPQYAGRHIAENARVFRMSCAPGVVRLTVKDANRYEKRESLNPALPMGSVRASRYDPAFAAGVNEIHDFIHGEAYGIALRYHAERMAARVAAFGREDRYNRVTEWSARSRSRMLETFATLDLSPVRELPGTPAMLTLTYPGDWQRFAPQSEVARRHLQRFRDRWRREIGPTFMLWKREFQRRGAPHYHLFAVVPLYVGKAQEPFRHWLSRTWNEIVYAGHYGPFTEADEAGRRDHLRAGTAVDFERSSRATDPRRLATYFLKHGTKSRDDKEYQHVVPHAWREASVGRFWGVWGFEKAVAHVDLDLEDYVVLRRTLRRHARSRGRRRSYVGSRMFGGWTLTASGPGLAVQLARVLDLRRTPADDGLSEIRRRASHRLYHH